MAGQKKLIAAGLLVIAALLAVVFFLILEPGAPGGDDALQGQTESSDSFYLVSRELDEVAYVSVENEYGFYDITQVDGGFYIYDVPPELTIGEYLLKALDESSLIEVREKVSEQLTDPQVFGLAEPRSRVEITYTDGETVQLLFGDEEPVTRSVYMQVAGDEAVYLAPRSRTVRFLMPVENYIQFEITPTKKLASALDVVKKASFSGSSLPEPFLIEWVDENNAADMREASAFGVATHLVKEPALHEIDQGVVGEAFQSMLGLMSEEIIGYNLSWDEINAYGFSEPDLAVDYLIRNGKEAALETISVKVAKQPDGSLYAICGDNMVVYRILDVAFTKLTYETAVMRWFLTPMTIDISSVTVTTAENVMEFTVTGENNKDMQAFLNGEEMDIARFRAYYSLLTSACHDGQGRTSKAPAGEPVLTVEYAYRDPLKENDVMRLYEGPPRKVLVEVNGIAEFTMSDVFLQRVLQAETDLKEGREIETDW